VCRHAYTLIHVYTYVRIHIKKDGVDSKELGFFWHTDQKRQVNKDQINPKLCGKQPMIIGMDRGKGEDRDGGCGKNETG